MVILRNRILDLIVFSNNIFLTYKKGMIVIKIGEVIRYFRKKNKITQEKLSYGICSVPYLSKLENNKLKPSSDILHHLCNRLDISTDQISNLSDTQILEELFQWNNLLMQSKYENALLLKKQLDFKLEYISNLNILNYYELFNIYHYIRIDDSQVSLEQINNILKKYSLMDSHQKYYMRKIQGFYYSKKNNWHEAKTFFEKAVQLGKLIGIADSDVYYSLSIIYSRLGEFLNSNTYVKNAHSLFHKDLNYDKMLDCEMILAINYLLQKKYSSSKEILDKMLNSANLNKIKTARILHNLGLLFYKQNDYTNAKKNLKDSLKYRTDDLFLMKSYFLLSDIYFILNQKKYAFSFYNLGSSLAENHQNTEYIYKFFILNQKHNNSCSSVQWITFLKDDAVPFFKEHGDQDDYLEVLTLLGDVYYVQKQYKKAADIYLKIFKEVLNKGGDFHEREVI
ncbi:tetratricopeptide repeat protein [Psychrobacillus sp. NPDC058041]|uniref:tetratricopeptide repeat protein n=1 Tax=Psychrobacillus sp. NPDC058041 TaxID=3346310 RepID=UPI0036DAEC12